VMIRIAKGDGCLRGVSRGIVLCLGCLEVLRVLMDQKWDGEVQGLLSMLELRRVVLVIVVEGGEGRLVEYLLGVSHLT
jgi:hypothetical protein